MKKQAQAKYNVGQILHHRLFDYRGVVFDVDPNFSNTDEWYALMARSRPSKNQPWYHVLVNGTDYTTYVAEQNLEDDFIGTEISHPEMKKYFGKLENGRYTLKDLPN